MAWYNASWGYRVKVTVESGFVYNTDPQQSGTSSGFGFGEWANVRYRGQIFWSWYDNGTITKIGFDRHKGSKGVKVYFDTVSGSAPEHAVGSELYSFTITNANLTDGYGEYTLPTPLAINKDTRYCFYLAPWDTTGDAYSDDYQDCHGANSITGTATSSEITNTGGSWSTESLSHHYRVYISSSTYDDFAVYVDLSDLPAGFHSHVNQTDARDIRVTTSDGETEVPREVVYYDAANDKGELFFKGDISRDSDTDFYIYYGNASASDYAHTDTYGTHNVWSSNYKAVLHMNQDPSGTAPQMLDSTSNANDFTSGGTMLTEDLVDGKIGKALDFEGTDDCLTKSSFTGLITGANVRTVSAWVWFDNLTGTFQGVAGWGGTSMSNGYWWYSLAIETAGIGWYFWLYNIDVYTTTALTEGAWVYYTWLYDGTAIRHYTNTTEWISSDVTLNTQSSDVIIAKDTNPRYLNGKIGEFRISNTYQKLNWITTEYNNQNSPDTFYTPGAEEEPPAGGLSGSMVASMSFSGTLTTGAT